MADQKRILFVTTEIFPYQEDSDMGASVNKMALKMHREGNDVRVVMPKFGFVSERKFKLNEVIRLSGMNVIINDLDQPLIIKVASLPGERLQVYFIDNNEYFNRKAYYTDENGAFFEDNDERAVFFARGVIETIKKLNWVPDIIHFSGWMASFIPIYLKNFYKKDYYFSNTKLVMSVYNEPEVVFNEKIEEVLAFDKIKNLKALEYNKSQYFVGDAMELVDVVVKGDEVLEGDIEAIYEQSAGNKKDYIDPDSISEAYV